MQNSDFILTIIKRFSHDPNLIFWGRNKNDNSRCRLSYDTLHNSFMVFADVPCAKNGYLSKTSLNNTFDLIEVISGEYAFLTTKEIEESSRLKLLTRTGKIVGALKSSMFGKEVRAYISVTDIGSCYIKKISYARFTSGALNDKPVVSEAIKSAHFTLVDQGGVEHHFEGQKLPFKANSTITLKANG